MTTLLLDFLRARTTVGVFALILLDLVTGILSAHRRGVFSPARLADVLSGPTLRHIGGYCAWWLVSRGGVEVLITPYVGDALASVIGQLLGAAGAGFSTLALWASISSNWREIQVPDATLGYPPAVLDVAQQAGRQP